MNPNIIEKLQEGQIGVIPTDTVYGIVGSALNPKTVVEIYKLRRRSKDKPFIILISSFNDLHRFNIKLTDTQIRFLKKLWPNPISVILPCINERFRYLHRGTKTLAFRMPKKDDLFGLIKKVGPLVAPSANIEGEKVSETIDDAKKYFGDKVAFFVDGGKIQSRPSTLLKLARDGSYKILRQGVLKLP